MQPTGEFSDLMALMARLRRECAWDKQQTNQSLIPYAIEETYELIEAIYDGDYEDIKGELGDVLLQVVFHATLYAEQGQFTMRDVIYTLQDKLIRRHPHVFARDVLTTEAQVTERWQQIKAQENAERAARGKPPRRVLDVVKAAPALQQAQALQTAAGKLGFDWDNLDEVVAKLEEEIAELKAILPPNLAHPLDSQLDATTRHALTLELGDCFFALVNIARKLGIDSETAALSCVHKFRSRFGYIEDALTAQGKTLDDTDLATMDALWQQAKQAENHPKNF